MYELPVKGTSSPFIEISEFLTVNFAGMYLLSDVIAKMFEVLVTRSIFILSRSIIESQLYIIPVITAFFILTAVELDIFKYPIDKSLISIFEAPEDIVAALGSIVLAQRE